MADWLCDIFPESIIYIYIIFLGRNYTMNKDVYDEIKDLADTYTTNLKEQVDARIDEMKKDDTAHYFLYNVLGVSDVEGDQIDIYQNKGRFLYKYAGSFLEEAALICFKHAYPNAQKVKIANPFGGTPKTFEIDCLVGMDAHELKWRDATTDGDHINKECRRVNAIKSYEYTPIRVMFYEPQRTQAQKIQSKLQTMYEELGGKYYSGENAWKYIENYTGVNLHEILSNIIATRKF